MARLGLILSTITALVALLGGFRYVVDTLRASRARKRMTGKWLTVLACLVLATSAQAEDLYIGQSAAGLDDGTSCANQHSATWFNTAGNWGVGAGKISAGDTAHLCGTITSTMTVQASGSAGSIITLLFESGAKLSQSVCSSTTGCLDTNSKTYITIDGGTNGTIENTANGTVLANQLSSIGLKATGCSNCEIKNLTVSNVYVHTNDLSDIAVSYDEVNAIRYSGSNISIHDNTIHDAGWAIYHPFGNDSTISIYNNAIYNSSHGITVGGFGAVTVSSISIYSNHVYDYDNWDTTANAYHHDGIHMYGSSNALGTDIDIYNNQFDGDCGDHMTGHIYIEGRADVSDTSWQRVRVFNNVAICGSTRTVNGIVWVNGGTSYEVYNNTIIGSTSSVCLNASKLASAKVKNNALSTCNNLIQFGTYGTVTFANNATDFNYNTYGNKGANAWNWAVVCPNCSNFATWQTNCGCDGNSTDNASLLVNVDGVPQSGSPVIGAGANLTSVGIAALNADKNASARPGAGAWDTGAYNYANSAPNAPILFISQAFSWVVTAVHLVAACGVAWRYRSVAVRYMAAMPSPKEMFWMYRYKRAVKRWQRQAPMMLPAPMMTVELSHGQHSQANQERHGRTFS